MIYAPLYDAGTRMMIDPFGDVPGMDQGYFRELDMERDWPEDRLTDINRLLRETPTKGTFRPWPEPFPWRCWVDDSDRYEGADGGPHLRLYHWPFWADGYAEAPANLSQIVAAADYDPNVDPNDERMVRSLTADEITEEMYASGEPTKFLRQLLYNEPGAKHGAACGLGRPMLLNQHAQYGSHFKLDIDYTPIFAPVDMRHPEWYDLLDEGGTRLSDDEKYQRLGFHNDSSYRLYLRPANWRWVAQVYVTYAYVSWFEAFYTYQWFVRAYFNRPPFYPVRHDLLHTTQDAPLEYRHVFYSLDSGIDLSFNMSRAAADLRRQIVDAQWWTLSEAYIYAGNDPATLVIWLYPPETGDIVLGVGEIDRLTGAEQLFWVQQNQDLTSVYPREVIGNYIVLDFAVTV